MHILLLPHAVPSPFFFPSSLGKSEITNTLRLNHYTHTAEKTGRGAHKGKMGKKKKEKSQRKEMMTGRHLLLLFFFSVVDLHSTDAAAKPIFPDKKTGVCFNSFLCS
jgi:hypothetical protein